MSYAIKEVFYTVQGEGYHAGTPALFVRFAGCNLWSGRDEHRDRDADRNGAECPRWCDTDFVDGDKWETAEGPKGLAAYIVACCPGDEADLPLVVFTGGEPLLQLDRALIAELREWFPKACFAVETNGTVEPKVPIGTRHGLDWVCVSPKLPVDRLALTSGHELKVVVPAYDPRDYEAIADGFEHRFISAEAETTSVGQSVIVADNLRRAASFVMENPAWRLTLQSHKIIGVP